MSTPHLFCTLLVLLAGCAGPAPDPSAPPPDSPTLVLDDNITTDDTGRCFARTRGATRTEVISDLIEVEPEIKDRNGVIQRPAVFRTVTRPRTVAVGDGTPFQIVCPQILTPDFVSTLQRALIVRRAYAGPVNGRYDAATSAAVAAFQQARGIDSPLLAIAVARDLGIVAVPL